MSGAAFCPIHFGVCVRTESGYYEDCHLCAAEKYMKPSDSTRLERLVIAVIHGNGRHYNTPSEIVRIAREIETEMASVSDPLAPPAPAPLSFPTDDHAPIFDRYYVIMTREKFDNAVLRVMEMATVQWWTNQTASQRAASLVALIKDEVRRDRCTDAPYSGPKAT